MAKMNNIIESMFISDYNHCYDTRKGVGPFYKLLEIYLEMSYKSKR
jgi:hypothetical protein